MSDSADSRVQLNLRVSEKVKHDFEDRVVEKYGSVHPHATTELEREFNLRLDDGPEGQLWSAVENVADAHGMDPREKETQSFTRSDVDDPVTTVVSYYVNESLRERIMQFAKGDYASAGEFVERVMRTYVDDDYGSLTERLVDRVQSRDPVERRTETIADELRERESFDTDQFDAAVTEAQGVDAGRYARQKYLPRVLDELGFTWAPEDTPRYVNAETVPATRDVRQKPYILMDEADRKLAFKTDAVAGLQNGKKAYTVEDGLDTLNGRPQPKTVKRLFREIAAEEAGVEYGDGSESVAAHHGGEQANHRLKLSPAKLERSPGSCARAREIINGEAVDWVDDAVELCPTDPPEQVLNSVIVNAKYDGSPPKDDDGHTAQSVLRAVTDEERELVRERLADDAGDEVEEEMEQLSNAERPNAADDAADGDGHAVADGGTVVAEDE
jgi:hypothetical protein